MSAEEGEGDGYGDCGETVTALGVRREESGRLKRWFGYLTVIGNSGVADERFLARKRKRIKGGGCGRIRVDKSWARNTASGLRAENRIRDEVDISEAGERGWLGGRESSTANDSPDMRGGIEKPRFYMLGNLLGVLKFFTLIPSRPSLPPLLLHLPRDNVEQRRYKMWGRWYK